MAKRHSRYFDQRFIRLLSRECVANELGANVCWLLTVIVLQQKVIEFRRGVTYYNEMLMPLAGFGSAAALKRARDKAINAGWLEYDKGGPSCPGLYSVRIPDRLANAWDGPISEAGSWDENDDKQTACQEGGTPPRDGYRNGDQASDHASDQASDQSEVTTAIFHRNKKRLSPPQPTKNKVSVPAIYFVQGSGLQNLTQSYVDELQARFPKVSVVFQIERMTRWFSAKWLEGWRETDDFNYHAFIVTWLSNEQQFGGQPGKQLVGQLSRKIAGRTKVS